MRKFLSHLSIILLKLISYLPFGFFYFASDIVFLLVWYIFGYRKKVVFENLKNSFPEKSEKEITEIAKKFFRHFGDLLVEPIKAYSISLSEIRKRVTFTNPEILQELYKKGKDVAIVLGHYGNWEMLLDTSSCSPHQYNVIYKPLSSKSFDKYLMQTRTRFGLNVMTMDDAFRTMALLQKQGVKTANYFIADQSPVETKYWTTFLNQETPVFLGPEKIAKKLKMAVVFADIIRIRRGYYQVIFTLICDDASVTKTNEVTNAHVRLLEKTIREQPQYWLWSHRRWKRKRPADMELQ